MDTSTILSKYDHLPEPQNQYEKAQLESAKKALRLLKKVSMLSQRTQACLCLSIISLCRRARLTTCERDSIFGQGFLEQQLFERLLDGDQEAIALALLETLDREEYEATARLAGDIADWAEIVEGMLDDFLLTHSTAAAILCLLANRLGNIQFLSIDLEEMRFVIEQHTTHIADLFKMI